MATTSLPTPVLVAGAAMCLLGGYVLGVVAGPDGPDRATATVTSYDPGTRALCLSGDAAAQAEGADDEGVLCGTWRRTPGQDAPREGDTFRFVSVSTADDPGVADDRARVLIYGDVEQG
ncbi:hypothetical protein [Nocardioides perillae]|uniref:Uncharacterized protein n=1 Tax=Nocardioides perillae TaxID=1119534 RepID=A0A7Y9UMI1_9ACTN|nr:hypothetical protein [Nocardioides perillae]NYG56127.1 hypothetical protein [Nocardioides perillae]